MSAIMFTDAQRTEAEARLLELRARCRRLGVTISCSGEHRSAEMLAHSLRFIKRTLPDLDVDAEVARVVGPENEKPWGG